MLQASRDAAVAARDSTTVELAAAVSANETSLREAEEAAVAAAAKVASLFAAERSAAAAAAVELQQACDQGAAELAVSQRKIVDLEELHKSIEQARHTSQARLATVAENTRALNAQLAASEVCG